MKKLRIDYDIGFNVHILSSQLDYMLWKSIKDFDITTQQYALLKPLWEKDGITQKELSNRTSKNAPTVTRMVTSLEEKGFLTRTLDALDRRHYRIFLTDKGKELEGKLDPVVVEVNKQQLRDFSDTDKKELFRLLDKLQQNIE
ncbi:MarR family transcriptional regulator [Priestia megaterium]